MYNLQCTAYIVQFTIHIVQYTMSTKHCTLYSVYCKLYNVQCTVYILYVQLVIPILFNNITYKYACNAYCFVHCIIFMVKMKSLSIFCNFYSRFRNVFQYLSKLPFIQTQTYRWIITISYILVFSHAHDNFIIQ